MRIGVFGGAFNPPHYGHLLVADEVRRDLGLDRVLFVPTFRPPHKHGRLAPYDARVWMTRLALRNRPGLALRDIEHRLPVPSYTVQTLKALERECRPARLHLVIGADQYRDMSRWHEPELLGMLARIIVMDRPGIARPPLHPAHRPGRVRFVSVIPVDVSADLARKRLAKGESVKYILPAAVARYIGRHRLYTS